MSWGSVRPGPVVQNKHFCLILYIKPWGIMHKTKSSCIKTCILCPKIFTINFDQFFSQLGDFNL